MQTITLTKQDIEACSGAADSYRVEVIRLLGGMIPGDTQPRKGWKLGIIGTTITRERYEQARSYAAMPKLKGIEHGEARGQLPLF